MGRGRLPRSAVWLTRVGCACRYRYGGTEWEPWGMPEWLCRLTREVCGLLRVVSLPDACNANLYLHGGEKVGWHADDEGLVGAVYQGALIVSLSFGAPRRFELRTAGGGGCAAAVVLGHGDLCTMGGAVQRFYEHRVPADPLCTAPRVNLTWRWIRCHGAGCSAGCGAGADAQGR